MLFLYSHFPHTAYWMLHKQIPSCFYNSTSNHILDKGIDDHTRVWLHEYLNLAFQLYKCELIGVLYLFKGIERLCGYERERETRIDILCHDQPTTRGVSHLSSSLIYSRMPCSLTIWAKMRMSCIGVVGDRETMGGGMWFCWVLGDEGWCAMASSYYYS